MEILKNLAALVKVKTLVTLTVITIFAILALRGDIGGDNVMVIVSTVIAFYLAQLQKSKQANKAAARFSEEPRRIFCSYSSGAGSVLTGGTVFWMDSVRVLE